MQALAASGGKAVRSCDASLWMNLLMVMLPVFIVIAVGAFLLGFVIDPARTRS